MQEPAKCEDCNNDVAVWMLKASHWLEWKKLCVSCYHWNDHKLRGRGVTVRRKRVEVPYLVTGTEGSAGREDAGALEDAPTS